jgi:hypothetical protein
MPQRSTLVSNDAVPNQFPKILIENPISIFLSNPFIALLSGKGRLVDACSFETHTPYKEGLK